VSAVDAELLAAVEQSPAATAAHDRAGWLSLFTADAIVEDPYGSQPHVGLDEIGRFYDTFIAPRQIVFHRDRDVFVGSTVVRDLALEIVMAEGVTLHVPMHLRYDLRDRRGEWAIARLRAHWELPAMMIPMLRHGAKSLPPSLRLVRELARNQGLGGSVGYLNAFRRVGKRGRRTVQAFLDAAVAGDEVSARRALRDGADVTLGEDARIGLGEIVDRVREGSWTKLIAAGDTVSASIDTSRGPAVIFCEINDATEGITRIQYFGST
jgi:hypothetical protein